MDNYENRNGEIEISLVDIFLTLLKKWWIIAVSAVTVGVIAFVYFAFLVTPTYVSSARVLVGREEDPRDTTTSFTINTLNIASDLTQEFRYLIKEPIVLDPVVEALKLNTSSYSLANSISVSTPGSNLRILDISVQATTPEAAYKINNELINQCEQILPTIHDHAKIKIIVTSPASLPTSPTAPNVGLYTVVGIFIGAVLSAVVILGYDMIVKKKVFSPSKGYAGTTEPEAVNGNADTSSTEVSALENAPAAAKKTKTAASSNESKE